MRPYEVMIIFDVELEQNDIAQRLDRVADLIKAGGGTPGQVDHWGRRTFAYELNHRTEGYYVLDEMAAEPATMAQVDRMLTIDDAVLRHKIMRQPDAAKRSRPSSGSRRPGSRGPGSSGRAPGAGRPPAGRSTAGSSGPRPSGGGASSGAGTGAGSGSDGADPAPAGPIEGAGQPVAASGAPSGDQEPATS